MLVSKSRLVIGLTTFYHEYLQISIPALARLDRKFTLIIHNDNPDIVLTRRYIRRLGYRGPLRIINAQTNRGLLGARLAILNYVNLHHIRSDWFMFADDDDIVVSLDIPVVSPETFAVIQNKVVIRSRLIDVLRVMHCPDNYTIDDKNVCLVRPHIGLAGTLVRYDAILQLGFVLSSVYSDLFDIGNSLRFLPPIDAMMWSGLNMVMRASNTSSIPIYMDKTNYIALDIDSAPDKYGMPTAPQKNVLVQIKRVLARYNSVILSALNSNDAAAPSGQE